KKGRLEEAVAAFEQAIRLNPKMDKAHSNLGTAWYRQSRLARVRGQPERARGQLERAIGAASRAVELNPSSAANHYNLGTFLQAAADFRGASAAHREAIRLDRNLAEAYCSLCQALQEQGQFAEALVAIQEGHRLGSAKARWPYSSDQWLKQAQRIVELDAKLPGILDR